MKPITKLYKSLMAKAVWNGSADTSGGWVVRKPKFWRGPVMANGYVYVSRIIASRKLGRQLTRKELVIFKDGTKDPRPTNIFVTTRTGLLRWNRRGLEANRICEYCGREFRVTKREVGRFCRRSCRYPHHDVNDLEEGGKFFKRKFQPYLRDVEAIRKR